MYKLLIAIGLLLFSSASFAQDYTGTWFDPLYNGVGMDLHSLDNDVVAGEFLAPSMFGIFPDPIWFTVQGVPDAQGTLPMYRVDKGQALSYTQVGTVQLDLHGDVLEAEVQIRSWGAPVFSPSPFPITYDLIMVKLAD